MNGISNLSILVADDDPIVRERMRGLLLSLGVEEIETANDGRETLSILADHGGRINVLITDLMMPDTDGIEILFTVNDTPFNGKIVIISSANPILLDTARLYAEKRDIQVIGLLTKPVFSEELRLLLAEC